MTIVPGEGFLGKVTLAPRPLTRWQTQRRVEQHALVCLVGPAAHARFARREKWPRGYEHDLDGAHSWLSSESGDERETKAWVALIAHFAERDRRDRSIVITGIAAS